MKKSREKEGKKGKRKKEGRKKEKEREKRLRKQISGDTSEGRSPGTDNASDTK